LKLLTVYGVTGQKTYRGGLGLSGYISPLKTHPNFPYFTQPLLKALMLEAPTAR